VIAASPTLRNTDCRRVGEMDRLRHAHPTAQRHPRPRDLSPSRFYGREGVIVAMVADRYRVEVGDGGTVLRAHEVEVLPPVDDRVKRS
jgi:hypothetical protein